MVWSVAWEEVLSQTSVCSPHSLPLRRFFDSHTTWHIVAFYCYSRIVAGRVPSRHFWASSSPGVQALSLGEAALLEVSKAAEEDRGDVAVVPGFVTTEESEGLLQEIRRTLRGKRYLYNHWDGVRLVVVCFQRLSYILTCISIILRPKTKFEF